MEIDGRKIDDGSVFFIAEAGVNHNGDLELAKDLIEVAASGGADAVKFQTFTADRLASRKAQKADYAKDSTDGDETQRDMLRRYELSMDDHRVLEAHCDDHGITFLSTPFDVESADLLNELGVPAIKLGSGELNNKPLLEHVAGFGMPMVMSTGMGTMDEVEDAHSWIRGVDSDADVAFLHCTSEYPSAMEDVNLRAMETMIDALPVPIGYSDHTIAVETPGFAVAAGARIVEKHFTLDSGLPGPDHAASLEPDELRNAVRVARDAAVARGDPRKMPTEAERENRRVIRKSLHAETDISQGAEFSRANTTVKRPTDGLPPAELDFILGRRAAKSITADDPITEACVEGRVGE